MVKYFCDKCWKEVENKECFHITFTTVKKGNVTPRKFCKGERVLDLCRECAASIIGEDVIVKNFDYLEGGDQQ